VRLWEENNKQVSTDAKILYLSDISDNELSNWNTYLDLKNELEFLYPKYWLIYHSPEATSTIQLVTPQHEMSYLSRREGYYKSVDFEVEVCPISLKCWNRNNFETKIYTTIDALLKDNEGSAAFHVDEFYPKVVFADGVEGYGFNEVDALGSVFKVDIQDGNKMYEIRFGSASDGSKLTDIQKKILSTFKIVRETDG
jgi:hypothetical protein